MKRIEFCMNDLINKVENDERILQFRFRYKNTLVWPFIRFFVYRAIKNDIYKLSQTPKEELSKKLKNRKRIQKIVKCIKMCLKTPFLWKKRDLLYFYGTTGNVISSDGKVYNRIFDEFVNEFHEKSGVIETVGEGKYHKDKHVDKRYLDPVELLIGVLCYLHKAHPEDILMADALMNYLCNECKIGISSSEALRLKKNILFWSKAIRYMSIIFPRMFGAIKPSVVFFEDGYFGGRNAYLVKILHEMGIKTVDIQHGWVGVNHEAYVQSEFLCNNNEYVEYMPDYFLGWSEYWLDKISIPGEKLPVGNPWFWKQYSDFLMAQDKKKAIARNQKTILWIVFENNDKSIKFLDEFISASNNEYYIRIRLHPSLSGNKSTYKKYDNNTKIIIDELPAIYDSFRVSDYVIAETSTTIYEAMAFGKPTYVLASEVARCFETTMVAPGFKNVNELLEMLNKEDNGMVDIVNNQKRFFGESWQEKFRFFIENILTC